MSRVTKNVMVYGIFLAAFQMFGQQKKITGIVVDSTSAVEFANAILLNEQDSIVAGTITNAEGYFEIEASEGEYSLKISFVGFDDLIQSVSLQDNIEMGTLLLKENTNELNEIVLISKRPIIERKADRLIFNVESSVTATGFNAIDVLRRTPRIDASSEGIKIVGKSSLKVMVNNRLLNLADSDLESYLKTLRSENIAKIEVITTPPAQFDAQGNSGLINIILKRRTDLGFDGSVAATYVQRNYPGFMPSSYLTYSTDKLYVSLNVFADTERKISDTDIDIEYSQLNRSSRASRDDKIQGISGGLNIDYKISKKANIGAIINGNYWDIDQKSKETTFFSIVGNTAIDSTLSLPFTNMNQYDYFSGSLYYDVKLDTIGSMLKLNYNYLQRNNNDDRILTNTSFEGNLGEQKDSNQANNIANAGYNVNSLNLDMVFPLGKALLEIGGKLSIINNESDISFFDITSGTPILDESQSDEFIYEENVWAGYVSLSSTIGDKIYSKIGLRFENTSTQGNSKSTNSTFENNFNNLFPSVFFSYDPNEKNSFSLSYSKRIDRPSFYDVNPFRTYINFFTFDSGNPRLIPSITHNADFSYLYDNNLSLTLYGSLLKDGSDYVTLTNEENNQIISRPENYYEQKTLGLDVSYTWDPTDWFNSYNSFSAYYNSSESEIPDITIPNFDGYGYYVSTRNTFTIDQERGNRVYLNFFQSFPNREGFTKAFNRANLEVGVTLSFFDQALVANISGYDIFRQNRNRVEEFYQDYLYASKIYNDVRSFNFSLTYKFGNKRTRSVYRRTDDSEKNRMQK